MRKLKWLVLVIVLVVASNLSVFAVDMPDDQEMTKEQGGQYGMEFGQLDGREDGAYDAQLGLSNNYKRHMLTDSQIQSKFALTKDDYYFTFYFMEAYKAYYEVNYKSAYREVVVSDMKGQYADAYEHGATVGDIQGRASATVDFNNRRTNDWERSFKDFVSNGSLAGRYYLTNESKSYQTNFEIAYKNAFMVSYQTQYQTLNVNYGIQNINYWKLGVNASDHIYTDAVPNYVNGQESLESAERFMISVPEGAVYSEVYIGITKEYDNVLNYNSQLKALTKSYKVITGTNSEPIKLEKPLTIAFDFSGDSFAGVYKLEGARWIYQVTGFAEGVITTQIPAGTYDGGVYAVFTDTSYVPFKDTTFNWAKNEISALKRRGAADTTDYFRPNDNITREEFAQIIYNLYHYDKPINYTPKTLATDVAGNSHELAINYVITKNFMTLDASMQFNPKATISYQEVEQVMSRILSASFSWKPIEEKMFYDKYTRSFSQNDMKHPVTRSEIAFMLYQVY